MSTRFSLSMELSKLTRDGTAEPVSRDQILRHARGQWNIHFPCSADHEQDWQPCPVDPYSAICDDHTYIHTYIHPELEYILSQPLWILFQAVSMYIAFVRVHPTRPDNIPTFSHIFLVDNFTIFYVK